MSVSIASIVGRQGPFICAAKDKSHELPGHEGHDLRAWTSPASTVEKAIPPIACRSRHGLSFERGDLSPMVLLVTQ